MNEVLVNADDYAASGATAEQSAMIREQGWTVVNAPRPLFGEVTWQGPFRHGIFYAAGPASNREGSFGWDAQDAWPVVLTTNAEVAAKIRAEYAAAYGETKVDTLLEQLGMTWPELAHSQGLPWRA